MDYKKILTGLLSTALKMDNGAVAELLNEENSENTEDTILSAIVQLDTTRISKLTTGKPGQTYQDGYKKGKSESLTNLEKELKGIYGIDSDKTGAELVADIIAGNTTTTEGAKLTDDDIKKHPVFLQMQRVLKQEKEAAIAAAKTDLENVQRQHSAEKTFESVRNKALAKLEGLNPILPENPEIARNLKDVFASSLKDYDYQLDGDNVIVLKKDGSIAVDAHGNNVELEDLVTTNASKFFVFQKNNGGNNSGSRKENEGVDKNKLPGYPAHITKPTNIEEVTAIINNKEYKLADRDIVLATWEAENKKP
jgi:hypothetical protein